MVRIRVVMNVSPISHRNQDVAQNIRTSRGDMEAVRLYWLPKEIAEMPRVEAPGPMRDDGVDKHPRLRNNAGTGVSGPELESKSRVAALLRIQIQTHITTRFGYYFWQSV